MKNIILLVILGLSIVGCAGNSRAIPSNKALEGNWERCSNYSGSSSKVSIQVVNGLLSETIEEFNSTSDCSGPADQSNSFTASLLLGPAGQSRAVFGGTDVNMSNVSPNTFLGSCSAGATLYSAVKISQSGNRFYSTNSIGCSPDDRGVNLDSQPFIRL